MCYGGLKVPSAKFLVHICWGKWEWDFDCGSMAIRLTIKWKFRWVSSLRLTLEYKMASARTQSPYMFLKTRRSANIPSNQIVQRTMKGTETRDFKTVCHVHRSL